mmetsp:Transcript_6368/g.9673  ORF Transcript_6368/g.9673 Transcript_6368/m.9673 type:complete len:96 (+) Transcript_6368:51-338(+)
MAFRQTMTKLAARNDVQINMTKWWKAYTPMNGVVTRHLSPFEQKIVTPWLKTIPKKIQAKAKLHLPLMLPGFLFAYLTVWYCDSQEHSIKMAHRD